MLGRIFNRSCLAQMPVRLRNSHIQRRYRSSSASTVDPEFGLLLDIDGVIVRGGKLLPTTKQAFELITNPAGDFWVPTIFVTNAGNVLRQNKAQQLSKILGLKVRPEQVVMSHSPLKMFRQYHDKHVLVSGQGPVLEIAKNLGFTKVTTIETLRQCFPNLDMVDHKRRTVGRSEFEKYFPPIEAVVLFGEPVRWETNLQLIIDILLTNGKPDSAPTEIPEPHLPVLACNMDLLWMSEACMPRFGHGCFLTALECLYKKISGRDLHYTALIGKPSEITYYHSEMVLSDEAKRLGIQAPQRIYCIGDNPDTDIYGANLYNRYLRKRLASQAQQTMESWKIQRQYKVVRGGKTVVSRAEADIVNELTSRDFIGAQKCDSLLVCTGVYSSHRDYSTGDNEEPIDHNHRDFLHDSSLRVPKQCVQDILEAFKSIFSKEGIS